MHRAAGKRASVPAEQNRGMEPDQPAMLALSAAVLAAVALMFSVCAWRERRRPGPLCWAAGLWLAGLGAGLAALQGPAWLGVLAQWLLLAWPLAVVSGLRHFRARQPLPGHAQQDAVFWAVAAAVVAADALSVTGPGAATALAPLILHLVVAVPLLLDDARSADRTPDPAGAPRHVPLALAALLVLSALAPSLLSGSAGAPLGTRVGHAGALAVASVVLAGLALSLIHRRREQQLRAAAKRLRQLANLDALTEVPNRRRFGELAERALRQDRPGSAVLIAFDIDHFKQVNDRLGHAAGDRALRLVAQAMVEHLRGADLAGRHGGDEFVLLLRSADTQDAMRAAARIVAAVQRRSQALQLPALTLSFGMVQVGAAEALPDALRRADQALYEAKRQGRSRAVAALGDEQAPVFAESRRLGLTPL
jgi:diguanylate cyclase (GGDEF)-like protein